MMFTYSKPLFGRATIRTVSTIAIVSMLAGYFTLFSQVQPSSAAPQTSTFHSTEVTFSDSRPSVTSNMQVTVTPSASINLTGCTTQPCAKINLIFPVDGNNAPIFTVATATVNEITLSVNDPQNPGSTLSIYNNGQADDITVGNYAAANGQNDMITLGLDTTNLAASTIAAFAGYTVTYGGNNITNAATTQTPYAMTVSLSADTGNGLAPAASGSTNVTFNDATTLSATVNTTLSFAVSAVASGNAVGSDTTDVTSTATTCPFGTLAPNTAKVCAQQLDIATNAANGYYVYIVQTQDMTSAGNDTIKQFSNGTRLDEANAATWTAPTGVGGQLGYSSAGTGSAFTSGNYAGIPTATANGVVTDGLLLSSLTQTTGDTSDAIYKIEVNAQQPAGTYTNVVTYLVAARY